MKKDKSRKRSTPPTLSEQRQIENEVVFRKANERVLKELSKLGKLAKAEGQDELIPDKNMILHFYCECSDENCRERIALPLSKYRELHKNRSKFILLPDHEAIAIEEVVMEKSDYSVVDKFLTPPETTTHLQKTPVNNT